MAEVASVENPNLAAWRGRRLPLVDSEPGAADLDAGVAAERLPGLADPAERARFVRELEHSTRRIDALARLADDPGSVDMREPAEGWNPLPAIVQWTRTGDRDEATWLAYLTTAFGPDERRGHETWYGTRVLYGGFGEGRVAWRDVADDPASLLELCRRHASEYARLPRGNHRKNEPRFNPDHPRGLCASVHDLVALADAHGGLAALMSGDDVSADARFERLMSQIRARVISFGRTGCFDLLILLGGLGLYELAPPRLYLAGSTGPLDGARRLLPGSRPIRDLDDTLSAVAHRIDVPLQAMEDALCNWQKH